MSFIRSAAALVALSLAVPASAATWSIDASHTRVGFSVRHMMISHVEGTFTGVSGNLEMEPGQVGELSLNVEVDMSTVDTANDQRDEHLRSPDFLDVASYPNMTFTSKSVRARRDGSFTITGDLTLHGVTKEITLAGTGLNQVVTDPWGNERVGATATSTINRQEFGVSYNQTLDAGGVMVGDNLALTIDVEFVKQAE